MRLSVIGLALVLASCATEQATFSTPAQLFTQATDTPTAVVPMPAGGKYKFKGPVSIIVQAGTGNVATPTVQGINKTGQRAEAVSTGAGSPVMASSKKGGPPWWVLLLIGGLSLAGWQWLKFSLHPKT